MAADDLYDNVRAFAALAPAGPRVNGTVNGATVDRKVGRVFFRSVMFVVMTGAITDGTHTVNVQESANGTVWTDVAAGDLRGGEPAASLTDDNVVYEMAYTGKARYVRLQLVTAGATTGGLVDGVALLGIQAVSR